MGTKESLYFVDGVCGPSLAYFEALMAAERLADLRRARHRDAHEGAWSSADATRLTVRLVRVSDGQLAATVRP